jgi:hypothetical protein
MRGTIGDRPWGWTLGALGLTQRTVQVVLRADGKEYRITFEHGAVVAATSPMAVDAVTRVALTNRMIAPIHVNEIKRRIAAAPNLDEVDVLAATADLDAEATRTLRTRLLTQRAARSFAVDSGDFEIEDCDVTSSACAVDVRAVIFMGARMNLSEDRLRFGLRHVASRFVLKPAVADTLALYNFSPKELPLLETLRAPTSLAELEANHREIDPRGVQSVVYALASCEALLELDLPFETSEPERAPADLPSDAFEELDIAQGTPGLSEPPTFEGPLTRTITSLELEMLGFREAVPPRVEAEETIPAKRAMIETFKTGRVTTIRPNPLKASEVVALINERTKLLARGVDHFTLLGLPIGAPIEDIHAAYVELQRNLSAKRLRELGIADSGLLAETLLAQVVIAFTVLTDRIRRNEYLATLQARPDKPHRPTR